MSNNKKFNHSHLKISYSNDEGSIADDFLVPCLKYCSHYRRTSYSFSSGALKSWSGSLSHIISDNVKIEILCDMSQLCEEDQQLKISLENSIDAVKKEQIINKYQNSIILTALSFDNNSEEYHSRSKLLDWMLAKGLLELRFAWPKSIKEGSRILTPLYHKKMGYFEYEDESSVAFKGSWNESIMGARHNSEECDVFSSQRESDKDRLTETKNTIDKEWNGGNKNFDVFPVSKEVLDQIKKQAPEFRPKNPIKPSIELAITEDEIEIENSEPEFTEKDLRSYQLDVLKGWESSSRRGLIKHATGSGKTFTALFAMRRHFELKNICLIVVPSALLLDQWEIEVKKIIPEVKGNILLAGDGHTEWKNSLKRFSNPKTTSPKVIIAIRNTAATDEFRKNLQGVDDLMIVADEVHTLGSNNYSKVLDINAGIRLGLSATPERYLDPIGTDKILKYFGGILEPVFELYDAIGHGPEKALVPYEYYPSSVNLTEDEISQWEEESEKISLEAARCRRTKGGDLIPTKMLQLMCINRAKIAKAAENKIDLSKKIILENYENNQRWLVYCESINQLEILYQLQLINVQSLLIIT